MNNTFLIKLNSHISNIREQYEHLPICELLVSIAKDAYIAGYTENVKTNNQQHYGKISIPNIIYNT